MTRSDLPWDKDPDARALVAEFGELTPFAIAEYLGITPQRVSQLIASGLRKLQVSGALTDFIGHEAHVTQWDLTVLEAPGDVGHRAWMDRREAA